MPRKSLFLFLKILRWTKLAKELRKLQFIQAYSENVVGLFFQSSNVARIFRT